MLKVKSTVFKYLQNLGKFTEKVQTPKSLELLRTGYKPLQYIRKIGFHFP